MSHNTFGHLFRVTTWGESHGIAIGAVVDGCPPNIVLDAATHLQPWLDKRKPGTSRFVTQRREDDAVQILSGVFEGKTTGTPIALHIANTDQRSHDYNAIAQAYRPGHADYTYQNKYGIRDPRGGGRSSARETACRVAAGAVARQVLAHLLPQPVAITAAVVQLGVKRAPAWHEADIAQNALFCPDASVVAEWEQYLDGIRKAGSSVGAIIEVRAHGLPAGLGAPLYGKLDADIAAALMSINAVKAVEIGEGFAAAALTGEQNADEILAHGHFTSNNAGGILGGISTGQPIVARFAVKPTSSILTPRRSITHDGTPAEVITKGRHDPCVGIRAVPVAEAMLACVLADHALRHLGQGLRFTV